MSDKYDPILISLVQKALPAIIAEELFNVQPMYSPFSKKEYPYQVDILMKIPFKDIVGVRKWCHETLSENEWNSTVQFFAFKTEEAYSWFTLRWL